MVANSFVEQSHIGNMLSTFSRSKKERYSRQCYGGSESGANVLVQQRAPT